MAEKVGDWIYQEIVDNILVTNGMPSKASAKKMANGLVEYRTIVLALEASYNKLKNELDVLEDNYDALERDYVSCRTSLDTYRNRPWWKFWV